MDQETVNKIGYGVGGFALLFAVGFGAYTLGTRGSAKAEPERQEAPREEPQEGRPAAAASASAAASAATPSARHPIYAEKSLDAAVKVAALGDSYNDNDPGTLLLLGWSHFNMTLESVKVSQSETTFGKVMKDPDEERGKRVCWSGTISQIDSEKLPIGGKVYVGQMMTGARNFVRFYAVGSTGELVERKPARLCGVVAGRYSFHNASGGTTHTTAVVGIFDLPENKERSLPALP